MNRSDFRGYQTRLVDFIKTHPRCAAWVDMGLGKTVSTLTAYADLLDGFDAKRMLVVAPLRVARKVWTDELSTWQHVDHLTASKAIGDPQTRWRGLTANADITLINREQVQWLEAQFIRLEGKKRKQIRKFPWDTIVLDESQSFREQSSQRWKSMSRLTKLAPRMIQLTGTPAPRGYQNVWAQIRLLDGGARLGINESDYLRRWFDSERHEENYTTWSLRAGADKEIQEHLKDIVMAMRAEDYLDLPPVLENSIRVELSRDVMRQYREFERERLLELRGQPITAKTAGAAAGKLLQFANGAVYHDKKGGWTWVHDEKLNALVDLLADTDGPAMVCYGFRHDLERLTKALGKVDKRVDVLTTQASEDRWNEGRTDVLILHPASAGHGLNLQHAGSTTLIWFGLTPDLEWYQQANARLIGGLRRRAGIVIHHIIAEGTRDERILDLLRGKDGTQDGLMRALS